jgi:predicted ester cyclase
MCYENRIVEEWLVSDGASMLLQLGLDPVVFGQNLGRQNPEAYTVGNKAMSERWADPKGLAIIGDEAIASRMMDTYSAIWQDKNLNVMAERYDRAVRFEGPANHVCFGRTAAGNWFYRVLAAIPDGRFQAHHVIVRQQADKAVRVALRWTYCGTHSGIGRYGEPTGAPVALLGISHFELRNGLIANEWLVMDETAVYAQIAAHQLT